VQQLFSSAAAVSSQARNGSTRVSNGSGDSIGYVIQTSPTSDHIIGFSGPTNVMIAFSMQDRILGIDVLASGDTRDHLRRVVRDKNFMSALNSLTVEQAMSKTNVDAVSGATLTSLAIIESIAYRLGGSARSLRFPDPPSLGSVKSLFSEAVAIEASADPARYRVLDATRSELGTVLRTSPAADNTVGYQGPTDTLIGLDRSGQVVGIAIGRTYDNEEYVAYVREDEYFCSLFSEMKLDDLASLDLEQAQVEGVSGATMTSMAVAEGIVLAATRASQTQQGQDKGGPGEMSWLEMLRSHELGTIVVVLAGVTIGLTHLRASKWLRVVWQLTLIGYLGLTAGSVLSQAMFVGWARHGIPWGNAIGLVCLSFAALTLPIFTRRNLYCSHLCPHGAAQQLLKRRIPWQPKLAPRVKRVLSLIPNLLLLWCVIVGLRWTGYSLVDIEPFDAYVFRVAGWAAITIAIAGLVASMFVPMAYCRYGCPTGAMLEFLRSDARADRWTARDWMAVAYLAAALALWWQ
jgi:uncharacterized protein with FMN-binding domain